jgi:hypothetical protein
VLHSMKKGSEMPASTILPRGRLVSKLRQNDFYRNGENKKAAVEQPLSERQCDLRLALAAKRGETKQAGAEQTCGCTSIRNINAGGLEDAGRVEKG